MERNSARAHGMKSDEKPFFCQIYGIFGGKMVHVVIDRYVSLFLKGLKIIVITDNPFNWQTKFRQFAKYGMLQWHYDKRTK